MPRQLRNRLAALALVAFGCGDGDGTPTPNCSKDEAARSSTCARFSTELLPPLDAGPDLGPLDAGADAQPSDAMK